MRYPWSLTASALLVLYVSQAGFAQQNSAPDAKNSPKKDVPEVIDILNLPEPATIPKPPPVPEIRIPIFTSCSIKDLEDRIHELRKLKASGDQSQLPALLDRIGAKIVEIARRTPNLVSDEAVTTEQNGMRLHRDYSYLVLSHASKSNAVFLDEFRIDARSGEKFQTDAMQAAAEHNADSAARPAGELPSGGLPGAGELPWTGGAPTSQGFVTQWVNFYPANRRQSEFRFLGEQKISGHRTLVVAFAQKPGMVPSPAVVSYDDKVYRLYIQGIAWVDVTDFRIVHLHTDILAPAPGLPLRQLSNEMDFADVRVAEIPSLLWLPRQVIVTSDIGGSRVQENHSYSNYRLFRTKSKLVLNQ